MLQILIVDDVREDLILAEGALRRCKILNRVTQMTSGEECIRYFTEAAEDADSCLLFLDLAMYPVGGGAVMEAISQTPLGKKSVVVMLSGIQDLKLVNQGYQSGAKTFLIKPLTPEDVMALLQTLKELIRVEKTSAGYQLHWIDQANQPEADSSRGSGREVSLRA